MAWFGCMGKRPPFDTIHIDVSDNITSFSMSGYGFDLSVSESVAEAFLTPQAETLNDIISSFNIPTYSFASATDNVSTTLVEPEPLFEYEDITIASSSDCIDTGIPYDFGTNPWKLEFSVNPSPTSESCIMSSNGRVEYYMANGDFRVWVNGNRIFTSGSNIQANDDVRFEYNGSGTAKLYVNDVLIATSNSFNPNYNTSSSSNIYLGYYHYGNDYVYQGTINYIKLTIM